MFEIIGKIVVLYFIVGLCFGTFYTVKEYNDVKRMCQGKSNFPLAITLLFIITVVIWPGILYDVVAGNEE